jgi:hypothetical protein
MPKESREVYQPGATHTRCIVEFHSDDNPNGGEVLRIGAEAGADKNLGRLISVRTSKTLGPASGTFTITIKKDQQEQKSKSLLRLWEDPEGMWVKIIWVVDGQLIDGMLGNVDSINETTIRNQDGSRSEGYTIIGRDHGKVFEQTECWLFPGEMGRVARSVIAYTDQILPKLSGSPSKIVRTLIEAWIGNYGLGEQQWRMPKSLGGGSFFEMLEHDLTVQSMDTPGHGFIDGITLFPVEDGMGNFWSVLQEYSNDVLNEMWMDLAPGLLGGNDNMVPALYLRERPFPTRLSGSQNWDLVPKHILRRGDVQARSLAKGGAANRYNVWLLEMQGISNTFGAAVATSTTIDGAKPGEPGSLVIANMSSVQRYGVRKWQRGTRALPFDDPENKESLAVLGVQWLRRIHDWYSLATMHLTGSLTTTRVVPEIRIGQRVEEERTEGNIVYYCEGIDNAWSYPNAGSSTVTVTRGEYDGASLLDKVYRQIENPPNALTAVQACFQEDTVQDPDAPGFDANSEAFLLNLAQGCKFQPPIGSVLEAGNIGTAASTPDFDVSGLLSDGAGTPEEDQLLGDRSGMIPQPDAESVQADRIGAGDPSATIAHPKPDSFGADELERGDDPLAALDDESNDPLSGIEEYIQQ